MRAAITMLHREGNKSMRKNARSNAFYRSAQIRCISAHIFIFMWHEYMGRYERTGIFL